MVNLYIRASEVQIGDVYYFREVLGIQPVTVDKESRIRFTLAGFSSPFETTSWHRLDIQRRLSRYDRPDPVL